jgi:hypothetical protein
LAVCDSSAIVEISPCSPKRTCAPAALQYNKRMLRRNRT